jgi:hypothetical protein
MLRGCVRRLETSPSRAQPFHLNRSASCQLGSIIWLTKQKRSAYQKPSRKGLARPIS